MKLLFILVSFIAFQPTAYSSDSKLESVDFAYFTIDPHVIYTEKPGRPGGALVEYLEKYIAPAMGIKINWKGPYSLMRLLEVIESGKLDGSMMFARAPFLEPLVLYPKEKDMFGQPAILVKKENPLKVIGSKKDLAGFTIAHFKLKRKGYINPIFLDKKISLEYIQGTNWMKRAVKMLAAGRVTAVAAPERHPFYYEVGQLGLKEGEFKVLKLPSAGRNFYTVFAKASPNGKRLLSKYNKVRKKINVSYEQYLKKYYEKLGIKKF